MRRIIFLLVAMASADIGMAQEAGSAQSNGTQAAEELLQVPHEALQPSVAHESVVISGPTDVSNDRKMDRKHHLRDFLLNRATKKVQKLLPASVAKKVNDDVHSLLYILVVVLLILIILSLLEEFLPFYFTGILILVLLILLLLWLLGAI
jgi:hypothetical protein